MSAEFRKLSRGTESRYSLKRTVSTENFIAVSAPRRIAQSETDLITVKFWRQITVDPVKEMTACNYAKFGDDVVVFAVARQWIIANQQLNFVTWTDDRCAQETENIEITCKTHKSVIYRRNLFPVSVKLIHENLALKLHVYHWPMTITLGYVDWLQYDQCKIIVFDPMMCKSLDAPLQEELLCWLFVVHVIMCQTWIASRPFGGWPVVSWLIHDSSSYCKGTSGLLHIMGSKKMILLF